MVLEILDQLLILALRTSIKLKGDIFVRDSGALHDVYVDTVTR